jgi:sugar phosphate isomerase/epimerase
VKIVLETHDAFSTGKAVAELLVLTDHPAVLSLWDLHHPYRQNEPAEETHRFLAPTLAHVHVKDGKDGVYTLLGDGDVPLFPMLDLILDGGYKGPISLEWEKRWHPEIADPEIAFPQYARALRGYLHTRSGSLG